MHVIVTSGVNFPMKKNFKPQVRDIYPYGTIVKRTPQEEIQMSYLS